MKELLYRLWQMFLGWGFVGLIYNISDRWQGPGYTLAPSWVDRIIPFSPHAIWLYLSFFCLIQLCYLICPRSRIVWLRSSMQLGAALAGMAYLLWPTTMNYPIDAAHSLSSRLLLTLSSVDSKQNCLPSLHMTLTALAVWAAIDRQHHWRNVLLIIWSVAIALSILQLRRHLFIDLLSGAVLAIIVGWFCQRRLLLGKKENSHG